MILKQFEHFIWNSSCSIWTNKCFLSREKVFEQVRFVFRFINMGSVGPKGPCRTVCFAELLCCFSFHTTSRFCVCTGRGQRWSLLWLISLESDPTRGKSCKLQLVMFQPSSPTQLGELFLALFLKLQAPVCDVCGPPLQTHRDSMELSALSPMTNHFLVRAV